MQNIQNITQAYSQTPWRKQVQWIGAFSAGISVRLADCCALSGRNRAGKPTAGREIQDMQIGRIETANTTSEKRELHSIEELKQRNADLQAQLAIYSQKIR